MQDVQTIPATQPHTVRIDDALLDQFAEAIETFEPPAELLSPSSVQGLSTAMAAFVTALGALNVDRIQRRYNWYERLTGLDLQERIEFDLAAYGLKEQMIELGVAANRSRRILDTLQSELPHLRDIQAHHERLIDWANRMLAGQDETDYHVGRFQRRLANLEALAAADRMTEAQMGLAMETLTSLLDRFTEIEKLLFPVWQQHAMAIAQSLTGSATETDEITRFTAIHQRLSERIRTSAHAAA